MNRFLTGKHENLAHLVQDLWTQNQDLRRKASLCNCDAGSAALSTPVLASDPAPTVPANEVYQAPWKRPYSGHD